MQDVYLAFFAYVVLLESGAVREIDVPRRLPNAQRTTRRVTQADRRRLMPATERRGQR